MKGGIACWISAVSNFVKYNKFKGSISIIISADEGNYRLWMSSNYKIFKKKR